MKVLICGILWQITVNIIWQISQTAMKEQLEKTEVCFWILRFQEVFPGAIHMRQTVRIYILHMTKKQRAYMEPEKIPFFI